MSLRWLSIFLLCFAACTKIQVSPEKENPVEVGFYGDGETLVGTRTVTGGDGLSSVWQEGDRIDVWAYSAGGDRVLNGQEFSVYAVDDSKSLFTSTISSPMPDGQYQYIATYPVPESISGDIAYFTVPSSQDGVSGGREDIMISPQVQSGPLMPVEWQSVSPDRLHLSMGHLLHRFRFYTGTSFGGEAVERLTLTFPSSVVGKIKVDIKDPSSITIISDGGSVIDVRPKDPVPPSEMSDRHYITASIVPAAFGVGEELSVEVYTHSGHRTVKVPLGGRTFAAGHSTPVSLGVVK